MGFSQMYPRSVVAVLLIVLGGSVSLPQSAYGQEETNMEDSPPATHSQWGVGIQLMPVLGTSVRWAATSRATVQIAAMPGLGGNFQGSIGGRWLYKFVANEGYNVFGSIGVTPLFGQSSTLGEDLTFERGIEVLWYKAVSVGAETALGTHFGLSVEGGVGHLGGEGESLLIPALGIGLHYYW